MRQSPNAIWRAPALLIGEFGPDLAVPYSAPLGQSCPSRYVGRTGFDAALLTRAYQHGVSWAAWSWKPWGDCWSPVQNFRWRTDQPVRDDCHVGPGPPGGGGRRLTIGDRVPCRAEPAFIPPPGARAGDTGYQRPAGSSGR
ncbi:MAG: hypothetical protein ACLPKE_23860 [Streptosporangiaceae bacterium]